MRLASHLKMTVREAQDRIDAREYALWRAYYEIEPFGEERADLRAAIIAMTIANVFRGRGRSYKAEDFMPDFDRRVRRQTNEQMWAILCVVAGMQNRKVAENGG